MAHKNFTRQSTMTQIIYYTLIMLCGIQKPNIRAANIGRNTKSPNENLEYKGE